VLLVSLSPPTHTHTHTPHSLVIMMMMCRAFCQIGNCVFEVANTSRNFPSRLLCRMNVKHGHPLIVELVRPYNLIIRRVFPVPAAYCPVIMLVKAGTNLCQLRAGVIRHSKSWKAGFFVRVMGKNCTQACYRRFILYCEGEIGPLLCVFCGNP
jgi:hypothetical protein